MSDFPDQDEQFELMYGDDLELLREQEEDDDDVASSVSKVRKSLDFNTPSNKCDPKTQGRDSRKDATTTLGLHNSLDYGNHELKNLRNDIEVNVVDEVVDDSLHSSTQVPYSNSKKRSAYELFGDSNDFVDLDSVNIAKKPKSNEDELTKDLELIHLILQKRNEFRKSHNTISTSVSAQRSIKNSERDQRNLSYSVPRCHSEEYEKEESKRVLEKHKFDSALTDNFKKIWEEAQELLLKDLIIVQDSGTDGTEMIDINGIQEKQLWVDLYKPKKYMELLSDESTNRILLRWMKLWDKVVFNRNPKIKAIPSNHDDKKKFFRHKELNSTLDEHGRPEHKVVLLCGPPGLGKTTLAHLVAKHAGYNVVEVNASDDRTVDAFRTTLENATQMRSVVDQEKRPNCIVFDEIDGAPQTSIDFLVKFITGAVPVKGKKSKTNEKRTNILKRPIICICNDVYVPALRPLRQIAFVIKFPNISSSRLAERLMEIARRQQIKTDIGAMMALAEKSNNDIRSCLSVLHFYKAQNKPIGLTDIYKASVGQKDMQKGLFSVWSDIFEVKRNKKISGGSVVASAKERMQDILSTIGSFGDHERVAQGVYENFPRLKMKDQGFQGISCAMDWFCFNDIVMKEIYAVQNYSLTNYLNYAFVMWHFIFASTQKQKLTYPSMSYEMRAKEIRQKAILAEVLRGMSPCLRCYNAVLSLILDVLSLLLIIISPPLRPVSLHLYTEAERNNLLRVAQIMTDYNLNYIQERTADGVYEFKLDPNIDELVIFNKTDYSRKEISYANKQLIAREIEMEKIRRLESSSMKKMEETNCLMTDERREDKDPPRKETRPEASKKAVALPNHLQTLQFKALKRAEKFSKVSFFLCQIM